MIDLLSRQGLQELQQFINRDTLFAFDLDGTLAPIVDDPAVVEIPDEIRRGMEQLAGLAITAIITGRSRQDAMYRLGFKPHFLIGNHGAEGLPGREEKAGVLAALILDWKAQLDAILSPEIAAATFFELKSSSLSMHYRHADHPQMVHTALLEAIKRLEPAPRRIGGKYVENLIPHGMPDKGGALLYLMRHSSCSHAFFLGDDETDEDVFKLNDPAVFSACVGVDRPTAARYVVERQPQTAHLIHKLVAAVNACLNQEKSLQATENQGAF